MAHDVPEPMMEAITEVFWMMQSELDQGRQLNISVWDDTAHQLTLDWWNTVRNRLDRRVSEVLVHAI